MTAVILLATTFVVFALSKFPRPLLCVMAVVLVKRGHACLFNKSGTRKTSVTDHRAGLLFNVSILPVQANETEQKVISCHNLAGLLFNGLKNRSCIGLAGLQ